MRLRVVIQARWKVLTKVGEDGRCELLEFLDGLQGELARDRDKVLRRLRYLAEQGIIRNEEQSRRIEGADRVFELKGGAVRVFYFFDRESIVICSHGVLKPKRRQVLGEARKAERLREDVARARHDGALVIEEEGR